MSNKGGMTAVVGIGGFRLALDRLMGHCVLVSEIDNEV